MKRPTFQTVEKKRIDALLLVDKEAIFLNALLTLLPKEAPVVVVSSDKPEIVESRPVGYVPFKSTMPSIPDSYYSHIYVVYNGEKEVLTLLPQFLEKAKNDGAKIFFIMDLFFADPSFVSELTYSYRNAHVFVVGDMFGKGVVPNHARTIYRFFHEAETSGKISVRGEGLSKTFPVVYDDVVREIVRSSFLPKLSKIGYLFPKHAPTEISLARLFQSINPFLRIDFVPDTEHAAEGMENSQKNSHITAAGEYLLQNNYPLLRKVKESGLLSEKHNTFTKPEPSLLDLLPPMPKKEEKVRMPLKPRYLVKPKKKRTFHFPTAYVFFALLLFFGPLLLMLALAAFGLITLSVAKDALMHADFAKASSQAKLSHALFSYAKTTDQVVSLQADMVGMGADSDKLSRYLSLGYDGSFAFTNVIDAASSYQTIFYKRSQNPQTEFVEASNKLKKAITVYEKVRAEQSLPGFGDMDGIVNLLGDTIDTYPSLLGFDKEKTYLVLFQNNMELRPTGGFIGSYGLLKLKDGSVSNFTIHDVYDADGQLTSHVEPAYPFRRFMGIVHQYLRDSNYNPDFPTAASASANMLYLETQKTVDGVIGVDVSFVKLLVAAANSIHVPDYNETVNSENFYMVTQSHVEKDFFPGSTQKKDFLRSLLTALQAKLSDQKSVSYLSLGKAVSQAISEKHIIFAFPDPSIQHLFAVNNMAGSLLDSRSFAKNQFNDFLGISEANIGANKANAFVSRKVDQKVTLNQVGKFQSTVTIRYKNSSSEWPGGDYKTYLRIITPKGSVLTDITIDGQKQNVTTAITDYLLYERPDFIPPTGLEVETVEQEGKALFGFLVIVPQGQFKTITLSYSLPISMSLSEQLLSYDLRFWKQPGTDAYPYSFVFSFPENYKALRATKGLTVLDNSILFEQIIATDQFFHIDLSKQ